MADIKQTGGVPLYKPLIPAEMEMKEFTLRAILLGLVMCVVLGAANAYLGLRAGMTIAATYPAAVIGMAILRLMKGNVLEENMARTVGSIGESVAAGAIFTLPAFYISGIWKEFYTPWHYVTASLILIAGGVLGIMFVALLRRVMVEDVELPFPESVAASEIHKTGRSTGTGSKFLFSAMAGGALIKALAEFKLFAETWERFIAFAKQTITGTTIPVQGGMLASSPGITPAYIGVGYIIGPRLGALNFSGGLLAWGLLVPAILYFLGPYVDIPSLANGFIKENAQAIKDAIAQSKEIPSIITQDEAISKAWISTAYSIWKFIVKPIAIGGMLMGAGFTLFKMRKSLAAGIGRSISDIKKAASGSGLSTIRTEKDIKFSGILIGIFCVAILTFYITGFIFGTDILPAIVAATVLIILAFFFAAISGYLVGIMGSSNNPISGLTLTALMVTALIMVTMGVDEFHGGITAVLGVAAIVCVAAAVAGEMLQDLKVGHILGGTPWKMQVGDIIGVVVAGLVMFLVLNWLNQADIAQGVNEGYEGGFGSPKLSAPQAGLMAMLSKGIVGGAMSWPLIIVGMLMGLAFILMQVRSPMLVSVGMYLPLETTFAIFVGGLLKGIVDLYNKKRKYNEAQRARVENVGILIAAGFIAGEALTGLAFAPFKIAEVTLLKFFTHPPIEIGLVVLLIIAAALIYIPLKNAGSPDEPAPPTAVF
jgi:OPT family oligopeptide transporter